MTSATVTATGKKVIAPISRPGLCKFGLPFSPDFVWRDGVYVCKDGKKELYFSCLLPVCQNGDPIEVGSLYLTTCGLVRVKSITPVFSIAQSFHFIVENGKGNDETLLGWEFESLFV